MVYQRSKKNYKKRGKLTKGKIFGNKSAKSQAKQIYALNKKVNYIQKTTKPELKIHTRNLYYKRFIDTNSRPVITDNSRTFLYSGHALNSEVEGVPDEDAGTGCIKMHGELMRIKHIKFFGQFGVYNDSTLCGDWALSPSKQLIERQPFTAYIRIVVCRLKKGGGRTPDTIMQQNPHEGDLSGTAYDCSYPVLGPLVQNITSQYDVLKSKVVKVDVTKPMKLFKFKLSTKKLGYTYRRPVDETNVNAAGQNEIAIYYQYVCPSLLRYITSGTDYVNIGPQVLFSMNYSIAYVDQN